MAEQSAESSPPLQAPLSPVLPDPPGWINRLPAIGSIFVGSVAPIIDPVAELRPIERKSQDHRTWVVSSGSHIPSRGHDDQDVRPRRRLVAD
jgi:hypothetical protein